MQSIELVVLRSGSLRGPLRVRAPTMALVLSGSGGSRPISVFMSKTLVQRETEWHSFVDAALGYLLVIPLTHKHAAAHLRRALPRRLPKLGDP
jgi:hypothetical protein